MYKIMVIEDEIKISKMMKDKLEKYGYKVIEVLEYDRIKAIFIEESPDLILLDINLPNYDGFYWCKEIRKVSKVPIIFVSARSSDMDQVMAIEKGGDDYIIKPFSFEILLIKVKSLLRRTYGEYKDEKKLNIVDIEGLILYKNQNVIEFNNKKIELSNKEFRLLDLLIENLNIIVSREMLLEELWDDINFVDDNTLSVNITRLRKQLKKIGIENAIETKRGSGYMIKENWSVDDDY